MKKTYKQLLKYMPKEVQMYLKQMLRLAKLTSIPVEAILAEDPNAKGITKPEAIEWVYAKTASILMRHIEENLALDGDPTPTEIEMLKEKSLIVIEKFVKRYRHPDAEICDINFIADFHEIACRPLTSIEPETPCYIFGDPIITHENEVENSFNSHWSWEIIKELDPELFQATKSATARASHFQSLPKPHPLIISYDVLGDVLLAKKLADQIKVLKKELDQVTTGESEVADFESQRAELAKSVTCFDEIFQNYPEVITGEDRHLAVFLLAEHFATLPSRNIQLMGPGNLCAPCPNFSPTGD